MLNMLQPRGALNLDTNCLLIKFYLNFWIFFTILVCWLIAKLLQIRPII